MKDIKLVNLLKENVVEMVWKYFDKNNSDLLTIRVDSNDCN